MLLQSFSKRGIFALAAFVSLLLILFYNKSDAVSFRSPATSSRGHSILRSIDNTTLGFEKIFIVGLPARTDRRDGMTLQAALSNMDFEFIDGVAGKDISDKAVPKTKERNRLPDGVLGCWRAHMDAMQEIVRRNISSALILEDDADWDINIRSQLRDFALSTNALIQPLAHNPNAYADPTYRANLNKADGPFDALEIPFDNLPATVAPRSSPYGDDWDLLWVGNCGLQFPFPDNTIPKGRVIHTNDITVAPKKDLWSIPQPFTLVEKYPAHTRAVSHVEEGVCTLGYAISQQGARRMLQEVALKDLSDAVDILLRFFCTGGKGRNAHNCLAPQPGFFHHHRMAGPNSAASDIGNHGEGFREKSMTDMVRWSVRLNAEALLEGKTDFVNQYPDETK